MVKIKLSNLSGRKIEKNQKVKVVGEITLRAPLKEIPNEYWNKVEVSNDWDQEYIESTNTVKTNRHRYTFSGAKEVPMLESVNNDSPWDRRFRNQTDLNNFRKYIANHEKERIIDMAWAGGQWGGKKAIKDITSNIWLFLPNPNELTQLLKDGNKLFVKNGYGRLNNKEAFEYLKSIINSYEIKANIKFTSGQEFILGDWDKWKTNAEDEIEISEQEVQAWQQCTNPQHQALEKQVQQLSELLFPNQAYNFEKLKQEIARLKHEELIPQLLKEKDNFEQLIINTKTKVGNLEKMVDLLLETQKQLLKNNDQLTQAQLQGQLTAYQNILEGNLAKEEIKILLTKQTELYRLEEHLTSLPQNLGQQAQILQLTNFPNTSSK